MLVWSKLPVCYSPAVTITYFLPSSDAHLFSQFPIYGSHTVTVLCFQPIGIAGVLTTFIATDSHLLGSVCPSITKVNIGASTHTLKMQYFDPHLQFKDMSYRLPNLRLTCLENFLGMAWCPNLHKIYTSK